MKDAWRLIAMTAYRIMHRVTTLLALLFLAFLALFSLDVLESGVSVGEAALALLMHNIPVLVLLAVVIIAWKFELAGGIVFLLGGFGFAVFSAFRAQPWTMALLNNLPLVLPPIVIGILYFICWSLKKGKRASSKT
jgi:hypothetical protein